MTLTQQRNSGRAKGRVLDAALAPALDLIRSRHLSSWEPWLPAHALPPAEAGPTYALARLLHLGESVPERSVAPATRRELLDLGLCLRSGELLTPGAWAVTSFRGVLAAAHREYGTATGDVYVGDDSLRFTAAVLDAAPTGRVLEIGCGSGVASLAAARTAGEVHGLDILDSAVEAFRVSVALNQPRAHCHAERADFRDLGVTDDVDTVIVNLPGVPVPEGVPYPTAGDGGPDGLRHIRALWEWFATGCEADRLVMRFQCLGGARAPAALPELAGLLPAAADIVVVTDSTVPVLVRNAITAERAAGLDPDRTAPEIFQLAQDRSMSRGWTHYHCSTLYVTRAGSGVRTYLPAGVGLDVERRYRGSAFSVSATDLALGVGAALPEVPDEFWAVDGPEAVSTVLGRLPDVYAALGDGATERDVASSLDHSASPVRLAAICLAVSLVARVLVDRSALVPEHPAAPADSAITW